MPDENSTGTKAAPLSAKAPAWLLALALVIALAIFVVAIFSLTTNPRLSTELAVALCIAGLTVLVSVIGLLSMLFTALGLSDRTKPLGYPEGSVRALISIVFVVIFALLGVYVYNTIGLVSQPGQTVGNQLVTIIGTLVASVSSFYFGTRTNASKEPAEPDVAEEEPRIAFKQPTPLPTTVSTGTFDLELETVPAGLAIGMKVFGGDANTLTRLTESNKFRYTPPAAPQGEVTLVFFLDKNSEIARQIVLKP